MKFKQAIIWTLALAVGAALGCLDHGALNAFMDFIASAYTRCFQFVAVPTVALAILTAMASLGDGKNMGRVFAKTLSLTVFTSFLAALVGLGLYLVVQPGALSPDALASVSEAAKGTVAKMAETPGMKLDVRKIREVFLCTGRWLDKTAIGRPHYYELESLYFTKGEKP